MNLFILLSALGLSYAINGERLIPIGTLYDPFIQRGLDALNYACYQDARFILVATPSGITLAPEGGAHQSIATPLIGMAQDGLAAFEPAFVDELAAILAFAFDYIQRDGEGEASERNWLRDETGGSIYLRLSTRPIEQIKRTMTPELRHAIVDGAYWLREPGPNCQVVVAYTGAVAPEAIQAVGLMAEDRRDVGLLAVTSADRLNAGWTAAQRARERGLVHARSHIEKLLADVPSNCGIVTVLDGHPATLAWLGAVHGHQTRPLGVEHFGQTGSIPDLYRHYGIDANAIVAAAATLTPGTADPASQGAAVAARSTSLKAPASWHDVTGTTGTGRDHQGARIASRKLCSTRSGFLKRGIVLGKPLVALEHVIPVQGRQERCLDPPAKPLFLTGVENRQGRRDFAAIDELGDDRLAVGGRKRARGITIITVVDRLAVHQSRGCSERRPAPVCARRRRSLNWVLRQRRRARIRWRGARAASSSD